ncbi:tyrosine-type recombinase/integrase [Clostridium haemolyticum]|uniref:Conserved hypothetical phage-related protein n=1 Tax=Clostridium haemolyticum NCTC 9693 TaxID=1443114 RepID=A0ABR4TAS7_CLOHA|nr:site-specific integrase [Clostridium haemolyticum]KEI14039.1 conserved hypothetical phage-related protein [Clostridium haemolyticum NCTC 9693]
MAKKRQYKRRFVTEEKMYNEDIKNRFIDYFYDNEQTKESIKRTFYLTNCYMESDLDKDVYDFNKYEIENLLKSFKATSEGSLGVRLAHLKKYIDFCISMGIRANAINFCDSITNLKDYVVRNMDKYKYITREQLYNICETIPSAQTAIIFILAFEGIVGKDKCEMRNLKIEDVDFENRTITVRAYDEVNPRTGEIVYKPERVLKNVDSRTLQYIQDAINETVMVLPENKSFTSPEIEVEKMRGARDERNRIFYLVKTDYVLRKSASKGEDTEYSEELNEPIPSPTIQTRIYNAINFFVGNESEEMYFVKKLNATSLEQSGMIEELEKIEKQKGDLKVSDFKYVIESRNKKTYYSLKKLWDHIKKEMDN